MLKSLIHASKFKLNLLNVSKLKTNETQGTFGNNSKPKQTQDDDKEDVKVAKGEYKEENHNCLVKTKMELCNTRPKPKVPNLKLISQYQTISHSIVNDITQCTIP